MAPYLADHLGATDAVVANQNSVIDLKMLWNHGMPLQETIPFFVNNWAAYLSPQFFFAHGDPNPTQSIQSIGAVGWVGGLLGITGVLVSAVKLTRLHIFLLYWLAAFPVADALTYYDATANSLRGLTGCVVWALLAAVGVRWLFALSEGIVSSMNAGPLLRWALVGLLTLATGVQSLVFLSSYWGSYSTTYGYLFETGYARIYQTIKARGLADVPITLHAGYERDAVLQYFSSYRIHATQSALACYPLPEELLNPVLPRLFVVKDDPGFAVLPGCIPRDLVGRDRATLEASLGRSSGRTRTLDVVDEFNLDPAGKFHAAIFYLHDR
jgi:hypothetical protein